MKKIFILVFCAIYAMIISGCSMFAPHTQIIRISGQPADAQLIVNGEIFMAPAAVRVKRDKKVYINAVKDGYYPYKATINTVLSTCGMLDVFGAAIFLLPGIGLVMPGAFEIEQDNFYYVLTPLNKND